MVIMEEEEEEEEEEDMGGVCLGMILIQQYVRVDST